MWKKLRQKIKELNRFNLVLTLLFMTALCLRNSEVITGKA
jgi:hypothetical protein